MQVLQQFSESEKNFTSKFPQTTFTSDGFSNWKKVLEKLSIHEDSEVLSHAVFIGQQQGIDSVLISQIQQEKLIGREAMKTMFDASKTMARQAIAFKGHTEVDSNFYQITRLISRNSSGSLKSWIQKKYAWTSLGPQNGILKLLYRGAMNVLIPAIKGSCCYGRRYKRCIKFRTDELVFEIHKQYFTVSETFLGSIDTPSTTGERVHV